MVAMLLGGAGVLVRMGHDRLGEVGDLKSLSLRASGLGLAAASVVAII